jgi:hypothetical protein
MAQDNGVDRRRFVQTVGGAGMHGAFGALRTAPLDAAQAPAGGEEFPKPAAMKSGAQLDSRFPVSFATSVSEGFRLVTEYFTAFSQRDLDGIAKTLHFPFAINEDIEPTVVRSAADLRSTPPASWNAGGGKSRMLRGSYDLLENINLLLYCPVGSAFSMTFTRYTPDGYKQLVCDGVYSVTNNDGRWGIQLVSTIVHEADYVGLRYPDAEEAATRAEQNYLAAFGYGNEAILNDPRSMRGTYEPPLPVGTKTASVNFGYGPRERSRDARQGHPMAGWKTKGVKSRLVVNTVSEQSQNRNIETNLAEFVDLAGGSVGTYGYTRDRPVRPVAIHATHDKAHILNGYFRYTPDGTLISETRSVGIRIYKAGHWGSGGSLGQVTHHDRSNSKG